MSDATIYVRSQGGDVVETNYWESEAERVGKFFLTLNAGCFRLLIPRQHQGVIEDMLTARLVVVSRGSWRGRDAVEILFDDGTDEPLSLHLDARQCVPLPDETWGREETTFSIWTAPRRRSSATAEQNRRPHRVDARPCRVRWVESLPCLRPWQE